MAQKKGGVDEFRDLVQGGRESTRIQDENRQLKAQLKETLQQLEDARQYRGLYIPEKVKGAKKRMILRAIFSDTHGNHVDKDAVGAFLSDLDHLDVDEAWGLGDHLECGGWLAGSKTLGYVAEIDEVSFEDDVGATNDLLDKIAERCPKIHLLAGNHENRIERWIIDAVRGHKRNAEWLARQIGPRNVLFLDKRGIKYYTQDGQHIEGSEERGIVKVGKTYMTHGFSTSKHAASATLDKYAGCVFYGHTHRADVATTRLVSTGLVAAWCGGCLCTFQARWNHNRPDGWTHGYLLQLVNVDDGSFHTIPVPIIKGRSYLADFMKVMS